MSTSSQIADFVVLFVAVAALGIGLLSALVGWVSDQLTRRRGRGARPTPSMVRHPPATLATAQDVALPLDAPGWLRRLNQQPDQLPHLLVVGPTGSGKTTFAVALLAERAGEIVALTPKLKPDDWRGLAVVSLAPDGSYAPLVGAIAALEAERKRRCVALAAGAQLASLTIVLDELPDLVDEVGGTGDLLRKLSQMGRDLRMRVVALATSELVEDLGLKGRGHARRNFAMVRLEPAQAGVQRVGTLQWGAAQQALDLSAVALLARRAQLADRQWRPAGSPPVLASAPRQRDADVGSHIGVAEVMPPRVARSVVAARDFRLAEGFQGAEVHFTASESEAAVSARDFSDLEIAQIAARIARGEKKSRVVQAMPRYSGPKYAAYAAYYERLRGAVDPGEKD